jgi:phosphatidylserine decarboxylase
MRIPLTKYGLPQVIAYPAIIVAVMIAYLFVGVLYLSAWAVISVEVLLAAALLWVFSFFRDPHRPVSAYKEILLAPADGKVTDIEIVGENNFIGGRALRIGVFLGIFDVHINRAPCNVKVEKITYKPGKYKNALNPASGRINESNDVAMIRTDSPEDKLVVRQISGAITRRIVCTARQGQELTGGEKFGMIKFGSRTELYLPVREDAKCLVRVGDKVKAGLTPIVRYEARKA